MKAKLFYKFKLTTLLVGVITTLNAQAVDLKFAHPAPESDLTHIMVINFKEKVEERSNGEIKVSLFPHGQLGNDQQLIDGMRSGIIDMIHAGFNNFTGLVPESSALTLPFIFADRQSAYKVLDGEIGTNIAQQFEQFNIKALGYAENGFRNITNNKQAIKHPDDLKGLRMRVNNSIALNNMFDLLGANPQQIPVAELYTALETKVVDAQDHPIGIVESFRFFEVQKYLSLSQHAYSSIFVVMNLEKFNSLSPEHQEIVLTASKEVVQEQRQSSIDMENEMLNNLEANGMIINKDVDSEAFQEVIKPVWQTHIDEHGDELINQIVAAQK